MWWILNKRDCLYTVWWAWVDHESGYLGIVTSWMNTNPPEQYESTKKKWIWSCNWLGKPKSCSYLTWEVFQVYAQCVHGITRLWVIISNKWKYFIRLNKNSGIWVPLPIVWYSSSLLPYKQRYSLPPPPGKYNFTIFSLKLWLEMFWASYPFRCSVRTIKYRKPV